MDFNRQLGPQRQIDRPQQDVDRLERFREEILRGLAPLEPRMSPEAGAPSSKRAVIQWTSDDVLATMPSYQTPHKCSFLPSRTFFFPGR
jgi:hypothetical protein